MKLLKRVLAVLCAIMMVVDLCLASCLTVYAREYYRAEDMIAEDSQPEMAALNVEETVPASEEIATQPAETPAADTEQTEVTTVAETTAVAVETESQAQTTVETQSGEMIESTESSSETEVKDEEAVITRYDYQSPEVNVLVTLSDPADLPDEAELVVTPVTLSQEAEKSIEEEAIKKNRAIENVFAYDIKFMLNGEEVQPGSTVQVKVSVPEITESQEVAVYHVAGDNAVENMDGNVDAAGDVVFETPHFSTYVIVNQGSTQVTVKLQHYDSKTNEAIYNESSHVLPVGSKIDDYRKTENYDVVRVTKINEQGEETEVSNFNEIQVASNVTYRIYYKAKQLSDVEGPVKFWDYQIKPEKGEGINADSNYAGGSGKNRMIMGTKKQNSDAKLDSGDYNAFGDNPKVNANNYNGVVTVTGLVTGLSADYSTVLWSVDQPGFFTDENVGADKGKQIYTDYKLNFSQTGNQYTLTSVKQPNGGKVNAGENFFPLQSPINDNVKGGKYYFGMRYDIVFTLGDYIGPLNYNFTGDDDLWVLLDGKVVIDIGGIHNAIASGDVDLWEKLGYTDGARPATDAEKNQEHRITVLYMERGAGESNCKMSYTLPNSRIINVDAAKTTQLQFTKTDNAVDEENRMGLSGAAFTLYSSDGVTVVQDNILSGENGTVTINNLMAGNYVLKEKTAPEGYVADTDKTWDVVVSDENGTLTAKLMDGNKEITSITNKTKQEAFNELVELDKTAELINWEDRTYKLTLTANSKSTTTIEGSVKPIDVVLVLDVSGSMDTTTNEYGLSGPVAFDDLQDNSYFVKDGTLYQVKWRNRQWRYKRYGSYDSWENLSDIPDYATLTYYKDYGRLTRLDALKSAVDTFLTTLEAKSPGSRVAIVTYSGHGTNNNPEYNEKTIIGLTSVGEKATIMEKVNLLKADGATYPSGAIKMAGDILDASSIDSKHVIFLTDGDCGQNTSSPSETERDKCITNATNLKNKGIKIHGIQFATTAAGYLSNVVTDLDENGEAKVYSSSDTATLVENFNLIVAGSVDNVPVPNASVVDYIDSRFVVTDQSGTPLGDGAQIYPDTTPIVGTLHVDSNGNQYIDWSSQTINVKNGDTPGWKAVIYVKAQKDYIGGNDVTTNGPESGITTEGGLNGKFPQPTVNVRAELKVANKEVTIYKGDTVPSDKQTVLKNMFSTDYVGKYGVEESDFTLKWYEDPECTMEITEAQLAESKPKVTTKYYLQVTYDAGNPSEQSTASTGGNIAGGETHIVKAINEDTVNYPNAEYGVYTINVISGKIKITKKLIEPSSSEQTFKFEVIKDGTHFMDVTFNVNAGATEAIYILETEPGALQGEVGLSRGVYEVKEVEENGYEVQNIANGEDTDCFFAVNSPESAIYHLGWEKQNGDSTEKIDVIKDYAYTPADGGVLGAVVFTNEEITSNWEIVKRSSSSTPQNPMLLEGAVFELKPEQGTSYFGKSNADGKVEWFTDEQCEVELTGTLPAGEYEFIEKKAPLGYAVSDENWTITISRRGALKSIAKGDVILDGTDVTENGVTTTYFYFDNEALYDLPSSGGIGIYWYTIGGMLFMMAAALVLYKNKHREVLKR